MNSTKVWRIMFHHQVNHIYQLKKSAWMFLIWTYSSSTMSWRCSFLFPVVVLQNLNNWLLHQIMMCYYFWFFRFLTFTKWVLTIFNICIHQTGYHWLKVHSNYSINITPFNISRNMSIIATTLMYAVVVSQIKHCLIGAATYMKHTQIALIKKSWCMSSW